MENVTLNIESMAEFAFVAAILQGSVKLSFDEWYRALMELDETVISDFTLLQQLLSALPPVDMLKKLSEAYNNRRDEMPEGELFAAKLSTINALPVRIDSIIFKMRFKEIMNDLKPVRIRILSECFSSIFH